MTNQPIYISRQQAENFLAEFARALKQPDSQPLLFQVWGMGGVGKTTLLRKLQETHQQQADIAEVSFGFTMDIETPIKLMATLYEQLPKPDIPPLLKRNVRELMPPADSFTSVYQQYQQTIVALQSQPVAGKSVQPEQQSALKDLLELGTLTALSTVGSPDMALGALGKAVGMLKDAPQAIASGKERVESLLQQHPATKGKKELQSLVREPLPKLTQAFVQGLIEKAQQRPIVLVLDTYEKAPSHLDLWLCQYLLGNSQLKSYPIRLVVAGRQSLLKTEYWRKLQQDHNLVYEQSLERFDPQQTAEYLQGMGITEPEQVEKIYQASKGLPYYLNWIRREKADGREIDFSQGNQAIVKLLLQGLNSTQKQVLQLAACCRWFNQALIRELLNSQNLDFYSAADKRDNCFDWLTKRDFVEFAQHRHRLDDVARDVFRLSLWQEDSELFYQIHGLLADYFEELANREVPHNSSPPAKYNHPDWRSNIAEFLYHALFTRRSNTELSFISHLFASGYLGQYEVVTIPVQAITAEADLTDYCLLNYTMRQFLITIQPAVESGWEVLVQEPINWELLANSGFSQSQIKATLHKCFSYTASLDGLAQFVALWCQSRRSPKNQRFDWLQQAKLQAEQIATPTETEFSSNLFSSVVGNELYNLGKLEDAIASYDQALEFKLDSHETWHNHGLALYNLGRLEEALISHDKALEFKPNSHETWNNRGLVLTNLGRLEEAITSYDKALELQPDKDIAWYSRGNTLSNLGRIEEAITSYDKSIEFNPDNDAAWYNRGNALYELGKLEEAIASYDKAIEFNPDNDAAWYNRGNALYELGKLEEAIISYDKALEFNPDNDAAWYNQGNALYELGKLEEAIASYDKALEFKPDYDGAWNNRGIALKELGRIEEAIASYDKALELKPDYDGAWNNRGIALKELGRIEEAIASYDKALEFNPDDAAWYNRGIALSELGRIEEALASWDKALEFNPDDEAAWYNRGVALAKLGRIEEALASYDKAIELKPNKDAAWYNKACCYALQNNCDLAIENLQQAIHLNPDKYREMAKTDSDFDNIRLDPRFQALI